MIQQLLQFPFMQHAFLAGMVIGLISPVIGVFLVVRRISLIADTLAHVTLAGVAAGIFINSSNFIMQSANPFLVNPVYMGMGFAAAGSLFVERMQKVYRYYQELSLPIILSAGTGLAVIFISLSSGFTQDLSGYLFGSLIAVSKFNLLVIILIAFLVIGTVLLLYKELFYLSFDQDGAVTAGIPKRVINRLFILLVALVIGISMNIVGILLVSSLITLPVAASLQIARSFKQTFLYAIIFSQVSVLGGLVVSYWMNWSTGGTIVLFAAVILSAVTIVKKLI
ncbi:metal ABC transporter permease [Microaerobacter geothermalis]|uniref:metal ABC transporter permease n=1 Tax=Microaerobacter geothermalis TaxID=674972 RepID=UPI001F1911E5|nr:metal ABC transporter permease [Microaerobacter geothermalis]MCF6093406.1 metal ABC transporter permease [Microaerobacter geothermalis]